MLTTQMIVNRVYEILYQQYPACNFYIQQKPGSIERPSFYLHLDTDRCEDNNSCYTNEATCIRIVYFAPMEGTVADELRPLSVYSLIKNIFRKGFIDVSDRILRIDLLRGGTQDNEIYLNVKLVYSDDKPQDEAGYDLIGQVYVK